MSHKKYNLSGSPLFKFTKELNNVIEFCAFCSACDKEEYFTRNYGLKVLCYNFANNLEKIYNNFSKNTELNDKRCNDFLYWWYYNLNYTYNKLSTSEYNKIVNAFKAVWKNIEILQKNQSDKLCKNYFEPLKSFEKCEKEKTVSDYCENYDFIKKELKKSNVNCAGFYYYLTENSNLYEKTVSKCRENEKNYCLGFNDCHTYDPKLLLDDGKCKQTKQAETERDNLEELAGKSTLCPPESRCVEDAFIYRSITFSDYRFISLIVLSIWAILLSLFFLYKFTPFGSSINNILRRKNIIKKNIHEEEFHELLESDSEDAPINFINREYRITYNRD
ncbi:PIR Superfamily Protein [Plasmodium ovale curtisi]|uniref:PIR Superfamily Protein n=1 Tax=Plasmodium ovale curtisi TaxID=864141 RepID=A0A1A8VR02_PLAOA|nr:PIR Superfamily Protein [Plasmodium ovale curtisi]SBS99580.1 PIR Superfamily Protein [Plasmodium ovale curtisi]